MEQNQETLISLYDYLGKAAGPEEGARVYAVAQKVKETVSSTYVENTRYKGKVMLYRREFLEMYFAIKESLELDLSVNALKNYITEK